MKPICKPSDFYKEETFLLERKSLLPREWLYLGHSSEFPLNTWVKRKIFAQHFVWVRRAAQTVEGFLDSCPHRGSPLNGNEDGFRCPYHGWTFNNHGALVQIPGPTENWKGCLDKNIKLHQIALEFCGPFLFGKIEGKKISLGRSLSDFFEPLRHLDEVCKYTAFSGTVEVACNWKLIVENSLDDLHVAVVHKEFGAGGIPSYRDLHYSFVEKRHSMAALTWEHIPNRFYELRDYDQQLSTRLGKTLEYRHYFIFPNVFFVSILGLVSFTFKVNPLTEKTSEIELTVFLNQGSNSERIADLAAKRITDFILHVIGEDKKGLEILQKASPIARYSAGFTQLEKRALYFESTYYKKLK